MNQAVDVLEWWRGTGGERCQVTLAWEHGGARVAATYDVTDAELWCMIQAHVGAHHGHDEGEYWRRQRFVLRTRIKG